MSAKEVGAGEGRLEKKVSWTAAVLRRGQPGEQ